MKKVLTLALAIALLPGCDFFSNDEVDGHEVLYSVTRSPVAGDVAIEYAQDGALVQDTLTGLVWTHAFMAESAALQLSAQNALDTGKVRAVILVDDEVVAADSTVSSSTTAATLQYDL